MKLQASPDVPVTDTVRQVLDLSELTDGWDGDGSLAPTHTAVTRACKWIMGLYAAVSDAGYRWLAPLVSDSGDGGVMFEWWHDKRKLTVYIGDGEARFLRVWGPNIESEMQDGTAEPASTLLPIWSWLTR